MLKRTITYTAPTDTYRPYLEVDFCNSVTGKCSPKTFGIVDSGADGIVIPYSLGREIGFQVPMAHELNESNIMTGIGGEAWHVRRKCYIHIIDTSDGVTYRFEETVSWIFPDPATQSRLAELSQQFDRLLQKLKIPVENEVTTESLQLELSKIEAEIKQKNKSLEPEILLGRPFFDNFKFLTFWHNDRSREHECSFEYEINQDKILETMSIPKHA